MRRGKCNFGSLADALDTYAEADGLLLSGMKISIYQWIQENHSKEHFDWLISNKREIERLKMELEPDNIDNSIKTGDRVLVKIEFSTLSSSNIVTVIGIFPGGRVYVQGDSSINLYTINLIDLVKLDPTSETSTGIAVGDRVLFNDCYVATVIDIIPEDKVNIKFDIENMKDNVVSANKLVKMMD